MTVYEAAWIEAQFDRFCEANIIGDDCTACPLFDRVKGLSDSCYDYIVKDEIGRAIVLGWCHDNPPQKTFYSELIDMVENGRLCVAHVFGYNCPLEQGERTLENCRACWGSEFELCPTKKDGD